VLPPSPAEAERRTACAASSLRRGPFWVEFDGALRALSVTCRSTTSAGWRGAHQCERSQHQVIRAVAGAVMLGCLYNAAFTCERSSRRRAAARLLSCT